MARIYVELILKGQRTINDVPARLREEVLGILTEMGLGDDPSVVSPA